MMVFERIKKFVTNLHPLTWVLALPLVMYVAFIATTMIVMLIPAVVLVVPPFVFQHIVNYVESKEVKK